jgi:surface protein
MFRNCGNLIELDLSSFNTKNVQDMSYLFFDCISLTCIYVSDLWTIANVTSWSNIFFGCGSLVGGNGTKCTTYNYSDISMAIIDGENGMPGYFTDISDMVK